MRSFSCLYLHRCKLGFHVRSCSTLPVYLVGFFFLIKILTLLIKLNKNVPSILFLSMCLYLWISRNGVWVGLVMICLSSPVTSRLLFSTQNILLLEWSTKIILHI